MVDQSLKGTFKVNEIGYNFRDYKNNVINRFQYQNKKVVLTILQ